MKKSLDKTASNCWSRVVTSVGVLVSLVGIIEPPSCTAGIIHPVKEWTEADKKLAKEALREWGREDLTFTEQTDCTIPASLTFRWEGDELFKDWTKEGGPNRENALGWWLGAKPFKDWDEKTFPLGEIYVNATFYPTKERRSPDKFYLDATPDNDDDDGYKPDKDVPTYLTSRKDFVFDNFDLLTVLKHEIGHFLGLPDTSDSKDLMGDTFRQGERIHPTEVQIARAKAGEYTYKFIKPIPEPSTFIIWSLLGALAITVGWWRRRREDRKS